MDKKYPTKRGQGNSLVPSFSPNNNYRIPSTIIPRYGSKDHNVAGQVKTMIHLKNTRGEEMDIYQTQQVLNLLNNNRSSWFVGDNNNIHRKYNGRKK